MTLGVNWVGQPKDEARYRVYWTRNELTDREVNVRKEVRGDLSWDDANSLCATLALQGQLPFVTRVLGVKRAA